MHPLQEKFQITVPAKDEAGESWASFESARESQAGVCGSENTVPPGMDITNQDNSEQHTQPFSLAGRSDISASHAGANALTAGFQKIDMKGSDDQYTGEHVDHFYGDSGGFAERQNYLDRM